ncbi:RNAse P, Rpr2/Rpp21 subunit [Elaphomyces granulatus]|jgi:ribonuclease P protein subunit RPR2
MGKTKGKTGSPGSHLRARIEYLHQAAVYLQSTSTRTSGLDAASTGTNEGNQERGGVEGEALQLPNVKPTETAAPTAPDLIMCPTNQAKDSSTARNLEERRNQTKKTRPSGLSRLYISQMRGVSLKSQHRLPRLIKRSFCKRCDALLAPGLTCTEEIRNESRERKKPWADILVIRCTACGTEKRFPQTQKRSKRLAARREENKGA